MRFIEMTFKQGRQEVLWLSLPVWRWWQIIKQSPMLLHWKKSGGVDHDWRLASIAHF
jgi:hypothetical protein